MHAHAYGSQSSVFSFHRGFGATNSDYQAEEVLPAEPSWWPSLGDLSQACTLHFVEP